MAQTNKALLIDQLALTWDVIELLRISRIVPPGKPEFLHNYDMRIGEYQELQVIRDSPHGFFLSDGEFAVLLPRSQTPSGLEIGHFLRVFVYTDSEDRPIATTATPKGVVGEFVYLRVVSVSASGAYLDWGLSKDLFCPFAEQPRKLQEGDFVVVRIYLDQLSQRVVCSANLRRFLNPSGEELEAGQEVKLFIAACNKDTLSVIINDSIRGTLFRDEWHETLRVGDVRKGYVKVIREADKKVAVSLRPQGYRAVLGERERILKALSANAGFLPMNDKSSPNEIQRRFKLSKSAFKKLIGTMMREGDITIEQYGIRLRKPNS